MKQEPLKPYFTIKETMALLKKSYFTIYRSIHSGKLKAEKVHVYETKNKPFEWQIPRSELTGLLEKELTEIQKRLQMVRENK
jgi:hypothetical protein